MALWQPCDQAGAAVVFGMRARGPHRVHEVALVVSEQQMALIWEGGKMATAALTPFWRATDSRYCQQGGIGSRPSLCELVAES